jgi:hypothetical protein
VCRSILTAVAITTLCLAAPAQWKRTVVLTAPAPSPGDEYGMDLDISGDVAVVAAPDESGGRVRVYRRSATNWLQESELDGSTLF